MNVPVDKQPTSNSLPRLINKNITISVKFKNSLSFQHSYCHENVRLTKFLIATHWLMTNSDLYQISNINIDDNWFNEVTKSANEQMIDFIHDNHATHQSSILDD